MDATLILVLKQRNTRDENQAIKQGRVLAGLRRTEALITATKTMSAVTWALALFAAITSRMWQCTIRRCWGNCWMPTIRVMDSGQIALTYRC